MLSRREVKQQVSEMQTDIRLMARDRNLSSSEMLPSVRELAQRYGISYSLVAQSLKALAEEGIIHSVPRVGSFLGRPQATEGGVYLLLMHRPHTNAHCASVQVGFEERIAQLGGACLTLDRDNAPLWEKSGQIPHIEGVFEFDEVEPPPGLWQVQDTVSARVKYGEVHSTETAIDGVYFDNVKGGQQAAQHLLALGHHHIAFLGLVGSDSVDESGDSLWSQERENGWRTALETAGYRTEGLVFRPKITPVPGPIEQTQAARQASENLIREEHITAVVATNSFAARGLLEALSAAKMPSEKWPAVVCFDTTNLDGLDKVAHLTTLRMPWEDLGRTAADLLWERSHGQSDDSPQQRLVPMRLITRLTSRRNWAQNVQIPDVQDSEVQDPAPQLHPAVA